MGMFLARKAATMIAAALVSLVLLGLTFALMAWAAYDGLTTWLGRDNGNTD